MPNPSISLLSCKVYNDVAMSISPLVVWNFTCEDDDGRLIADFLNWYMPYSLDVIRNNLIGMSIGSFNFTDSVRCQKIDSRIILFSSYSLLNEETYLIEDLKYEIELSYVLSIIDNACGIINSTESN